MTPEHTWVDHEEERYRLTCEALADVDGGVVIDQSEVRTWAESLGTKNSLAVPRR
jgi:hypothetical protein